jgi:2-oxoglutarate dehydrogenase E1 component
MSQNAAPKQSNMSFLTGANAEYISHLYGEFLSNPARVDESWQGFFEALNDNEIELLQELNGASWTPDENRKSTRRFDHIGEGAGIVEAAPAVKPAANKSVSSEDLRSQAKDSIRALKLIRAYRARGHLLSDLDPLELKEKNHHPELDPAHYGFGSEDYNREIFINGELGMETATLNAIVAALKQTLLRHDRR